LLFAALLAVPALSGAAEASKAIEQALAAAQQDKRGITLYVNGQAIGGAVTKIEPDKTVELRNQQFSRITIRIDRIDGIAQP
jgi:hypothetical protein